MSISKYWKVFLPTVVPGGFDNRKHPIFLQEAVINSSGCLEGRSINEAGTTEVFELGRKIYPLIESKLLEAREKAGINPYETLLPEKYLAPQSHSYDKK
jgi:hypothetical protein